MPYQRTETGPNENRTGSTVHVTAVVKKLLIIRQELLFYERRRVAGNHELLVGRHNDYFHAGVIG